MNANEYGNKLRINALEDITLNTNKVILTSPIPVVTEIVLTITEGLTVGTEQVTVEETGEVFNAGEYVVYTIKEGDIFISGDWKARLYSQPPGDAICKITDEPLFFPVSR